MPSAKTVSLLKVEGVFYFHKLGLIVFPVLPLPITGKFKPFDDKVTVQRPDGIWREFGAKFQVEALKPAKGPCTWNIVVVLNNASKADVPVGSELMVTEDTLALLRGEMIN